MGTIIGLVCFAGVVVFGALFIVMALKGGSLKIPAIGMGVFFLLVVAVGALTHFGIGPFGNSTADDSEEPTGAVESQSAGEDSDGIITVNFDVSVVGDSGKPEFQVKTNLPDETELMLTLNGDDFTGQAKVTVKNGEAVSEAFSNKGDALSGDYSLTISMSIPRLQSDYVRSIIGEKGEYIGGPYVENSEITGENVVSATFDIAIDGDLETDTNQGNDTQQDPDESPNVSASQNVIDIDTVMAILRITLSQNFGEDNYTLEYDDTSVTINVWQDGVAAGSVYAAAGDATAKAAWEFMIEGEKVLCNSVVEQMESIGVQNCYVMVNVLNDLDRSKTLLSILNGVVIYDAVGN